MADVACGFEIRNRLLVELFEFGFADGSWVTLNLPDLEAFRTQFSGLLPAGASRP